MGRARVGEGRQPGVRRGGGYTVLPSPRRAVRAGVSWTCLLPCPVCLGSLNSRQVCQGWERDLVKPGGVWVRMLLRAQVLTEAAGSVGNDMVDVTYW